MKKNLIYLIVALFLLSNSCTTVLAKSNNPNRMVNIAIKKYKKGNYTGCLQDCKNIVEKSPNAVAYYYMAMSYAQADKKEEAIDAYSKVLELNPNQTLFEYATTGKRCLENPEQNTVEASEEEIEIDEFITSHPDEFLSPSVKEKFQQKRLDNIKNEINTGKELDEFDFSKLNKSSIKKQTKLSTNKPSNKDIKTALKVLSDAGINPFNNQNLYQAKTQNHNTEMEQVLALMSDGKQSKNNDTMLNMLPFILTQNKNGKNEYSPQMLQAVIMNSLITDLNYDVDNDDKK